MLSEKTSFLGPLAPDSRAACALRFLVLRPGSHEIEPTQLIDLADGLEMVLETPVTVVVEQNSVTVFPRYEILKLGYTLGLGALGATSMAWLISSPYHLFLPVSTPRLRRCRQPNIIRREMSKSAASV